MLNLICCFCHKGCWFLRCCLDRKSITKTRYCKDEQLSVPDGEGHYFKSKIYAVCTDYFPFLHDLIGEKGILFGSRWGLASSVSLELQFPRGSDRAQTDPFEHLLN
jgi:hypothetical protein